MRIKNYLQKKFINLLVKNLFNAIDEKNIVEVKGRTMFVGGKETTDDKAQRIKKEAGAFEDSFIWQVVSNQVKYEANKKMFLKSVSTEDILHGKMALWVLEIIEKKLKELASLR